MESHNLRRNTSSTPIEIPRRRPNTSWKDSPYGRSASPDLIFEMSPVSPDFPPSTQPSRITDSVAKEPFMYSFPKISPPQIHTKPRRLLQPLRSLRPIKDTLRTPGPDTTEFDTPIHSLCSDNDEDILAPPLTYSSAKVTKSSSSSTTKITGFSPATPISMEAHAPTRGAKSKRLSPPPRTSSYSSSPWIMPGKSDVQHGESGSFDTDPSSFEFDRHLMRRIESQNPRRFRKISLLSSVRV